ncbi:CDKN2AIP N-terminal-like protein [Aquarana catesbeiana]|uniref:CDKN2AIP N-terminal-like protein n=1 Tax=Aquarana catesbeiana TaxID=8400 RepID=UPI003CC9878C
MCGKEPPFKVWWKRCFLFARGGVTLSSAVLKDSWKTSYRYSDELLGRVFDMANDIHIEDAPHFTTRDEIMKRNQSN